MNPKQRPTGQQHQEYQEEDRRSQPCNTKGKSVAKKLRPSRLSLRRFSASSRSNISRSWSDIGSICEKTIVDIVDSNKTSDGQVAPCYENNVYTMRMCRIVSRKREQVFVQHELWPYVRLIHNLMRIAYHNPHKYAHLPCLMTRAQVEYHQLFPVLALSYKSPANVEQIF